MKNGFLRIISLQLAIFLIYMGIVWYNYVTYRYDDPVALGIQGWFCILVHLAVTLIVGVIVLIRSKDRNQSLKYGLAAISSVIIYAALVTLFSGAIEPYLRGLR